MFENRTILVSHVPVSQETFELVQDELNRRYLVQQQHLADHRATCDDRRLLEAALARRLGRPVGEPVILEGAGFFFDEASSERRTLRGPARPRGGAPRRSWRFASGWTWLLGPTA